MTKILNIEYKAPRPTYYHESPQLYKLTVDSLVATDSGLLLFQSEMRDLAQIGSKIYLKTRLSGYEVKPQLQRPKSWRKRLAPGHVFQKVFNNSYDDEVVDRTRFQKLWQIGTDESISEDYERYKFRWTDTLADYQEILSKIAALSFMNITILPEVPNEEAIATLFKPLEEIVRNPRTRFAAQQIENTNDGLDPFP